MQQFKIKTPNLKVMDVNAVCRLVSNEAIVQGKTVRVLGSPQAGRPCIAIAKVGGVQIGMVNSSKSGFANAYRLAMAVVEDMKANDLIPNKTHFYATRADNMNAD